MQWFDTSLRSSMNIYFWFIAGMLTGFAAALVVLPIARGAAQMMAHRKVRLAIGAAAAAAFGGVALLLYHMFGSPELLATGASARSSPHPTIDAMGTSNAAAPMEDAVARLEARVASNTGKREDWLLLAQSYEFLGRTTDAKNARAKAEGRDSTPPAREDVQRLRSLATGYRKRHDYAKARGAYAKLVQLDGMDADLWADYADTLASESNGSLQGEAASAIDRALTINPAHPKALWLKASLAHEEHRYADALTVWKQLRAALPVDSPDIRIVEANIGEAGQLAGQPAPPAVSQQAAATADVMAISGTVSIDTRLATRVPAGATLFIYAKSADSPGPPLAVLRQVAGVWPVTFRLDDTLAMLPTQRLSQFDKVIVEARISRSGQATPARGDLYVTSKVLRPADGKRLQLVIDNEVS
jgi:cytochrome c-type biogenesis protein CcmH